MTTRNKYGIMCGICVYTMKKSTATRNTDGLLAVSDFILFIRQQQKYKTFQLKIKGNDLEICYGLKFCVYVFFFLVCWFWLVGNFLYPWSIYTYRRVHTKYSHIKVVGMRFHEKIIWWFFSGLCVKIINKYK